MSVNDAWASNADLLTKISAIVLAPFAGSIEANETLCLQTMTDLIEIMKRPESEQAPAFARVDAMAKDWRQPVLFRLLLPAVTKVREAYLRNQARLRSAVAAIAVERYRRKHGAWPDKLDALVPVELKEVGLDPYNGKPLQFQRLPDGWVVFSVGVNGIEEGDLIQAAKASSTGFRLWDVNQRRLKPVDPPTGSPEK